MAPTVWLDEVRRLVGPEAVIADEEVIRQHSYDRWPVALKWKQQGKQPYKPEVIIRPREVAQVASLLKWASKSRVPVTPWGGGSGVTGAALAIQGGICLDMSAMDRTLAMDETSLLVRVQAGKMGHHLENELNQRGYTLNHSPQSLNRSSVGGWVATRAVGQFSSRWGAIEDLVAAFTVVLPTGETVETGLAPRAAIGPDLRHLFMGAEGTMGVITDVTLKIYPLAQHRVFETLAFESLEAGLAAMRKIMRVGLRPFLVRLYDEVETPFALQEDGFVGRAMFLGFEGLEAVAKAEHAAGIELCLAEGGRVIGPAPALAWMDRRFDFSAVQKYLDARGGVAETIEVAHFWDGILETYHALKAALGPLATHVLGHFSHVYPQGTSLYLILLGYANDDAEAEERLLMIWDTAMRVCLETGAAISHHHGIGIARQPYVRDYLGSMAVVLDRVKAALDPSGIMNPGKLGFR
jgi:alkyldihydroxyacetonephosphate synthase